MYLQHLKIDSSEISPFVLLPGDPSRVDLIGKKLEGFEIINQNREFRIGKGKYQKIEITVCSTGVGCPSTAIAVEELINAGAQALIRVGTCGGAWRSEIKAGSLVIPTACIREEGATKEYIPKSFPAVADFSIVDALIKSAKSERADYFVGINRTHDSFYGNLASVRKWGRYLTEKGWEDKKTPILSSEMEAAVLFVIASLKNVKAGAILAVNSDPEPLRDRVLGADLVVEVEKSKKFSSQVVDSAIQVALNALSELK